MDTWRVAAALVGGLFASVPASLIVADALGDADNLGYPLAGVFAGVGLALLRLAGLERR